MNDKIEIVLAQFNAVVGDLDGNTERIISIIKDNRSYGSPRIFVFPELALCGYSPEDLLFREDFAIAINKSISKIVDNIKSDEYLILGAPHYSDDLSKIWNSAYLINNKGIKSIYDKQILPNYGVFDEKRYFITGSDNLVFDIAGNKICIMICEDLWDFSSINKDKLNDIDFLISINASPYENNKDSERINFIKEIALKNKFNIIYLNKVGGQD